MSKYEEQREAARQAVLDMLSRITGEDRKVIEDDWQEFKDSMSKPDQDTEDLEVARLRAAGVMKFIPELGLPDDIDEHCETCSEDFCEDCCDECDGTDDSDLTSEFMDTISNVLERVRKGSNSSSEVRDLVSAYATYKVTING